MSIYNKITAVVMAVLLIAVGAIFTVMYFADFLADSLCYSFDAPDVFSLGLCIAMLLATVLGIVSLVLILMNKTGRVAKVIYLVTGVLSIPVVFATGVWLLSFVGFDFAPPPQR